MHLFFSCLLLFCSSLAVAQETGLTFLRIGTTAREQSMANVGTASVKGAAANFYNPAKLLEGDESSVLFSQNLYIFDTYSSYVGAKFKTEKAAWGVALTWLSVRDIPLRTRATTEPDGFFDSQNAALSISYARPILSGFDVALTGKLIYEKIFIDESQGYAMDVSAIYRRPNSLLTIAFSLQNLGKMDQLQSVSTILPTLIRAGAAYPFTLESFGGNLLIEGGIESVFQGKTYINLGGEYEFRKLFWIRLGYMLGNESRSVSGGIGIKYSYFTFDYAFIPFSNELGSANLLTLQVYY